MNKVLKIIIISLVILLNGCASKIVLQHKTNNESVILRMNKNIQMITVIKFPFNLVIKNSSFKKEEFISIDYEYGFIRKGSGIELYENNQRISNNELKVIPSHTDVEYTVYSRHFTDSTAFTQNQLKPYIEKMLLLNQDTLHIGSVTEFKENHKELFNLLTHNDTISIRFMDKKNERSLGIKHSIPASW